MQFLKNHWMSLVSGVVGLAAIAGLVLGMTQKNVINELNKRVSAAAQIDTLKSGAQNEETINAEKERGQKFDEQYKTTLEKAASINKREPLLEGVFPKPAQPYLAYQFQELYRDKLYELPRAMLAGGLPSKEDVEDELEIMNEEAARRKERGVDDDSDKGGGGGGPKAPAPAPAGGGLLPGGPSMGGGPAQPPPPPLGGGLTPGGGGGGSGLPASATPQQADAQRRAAIRKAHNIRVYAEVNPQRPVFHISPIWQAESSPTTKEMWYAQVSYWIQQDIVDVIRKLNDEAAQGVKDADLNVGSMVVKRVMGIRVHGYINAGGQLVRFDSLTGSVSSGAGAATGEMKPSFTGRKSDAQFDVVRFSVTVVIDQRDLLKFIDRMTRENFYQCVALEFGPAVGTTEEEKQYYYGTAPVVRATFDFEGFMARKVYGALMPEEVQKELAAGGGK